MKLRVIEITLRLWYVSIEFDPRWFRWVLSPQRICRLADSLEQQYNTYPSFRRRPRRLVAHGRHDDARQALKRLRPSTTDHQLLEEELHECVVIISLLWFVIDSKGKVYICNLRWAKLLCYIFERIQSSEILSYLICLFHKPVNSITLVFRNIWSLWEQTGITLSMEAIRWSGITTTICLGKDQF